MLFRSYRLRERIAEGLRHPGPTLFSVYTGSAEKLPDLPAYLRSAIATQGRVFPGFSFDPAAGDDWGSRLRLEDNPQPAADWPLDRLAYEDEALQRVCEEVAFTFVDFAAADARHARHLSPVPRADWGDDMVSVQEYLELGHRTWINDSYWMFMPYKLLDPGVTLAYAGERALEDGRLKPGLD